jgi:hypothetical protein
MPTEALALILRALRVDQETPAELPTPAHRVGQQAVVALTRTARIARHQPSGHSGREARGAQTTAQQVVEAGTAEEGHIVVVEVGVLPTPL